MSSKISDLPNMSPHVRIQIEVTKRGLAVLVVGAEKNRCRAALDNALLEIHDERATDAASLQVGPDDQRVKLPRVSAVMPDTTYPSERSALVGDGDAAHAIRRE